MKWISPLEQSFIDKGVQLGLEQGLEQGLERGRQEGAAVVLERLLEQRFGPLPQTVRKKLAQADLARIQAWCDALPEAHSLKQVFR
jgi:flagellar biosynthesis/type III secretory pathway protein FliH